MFKSCQGDVTDPSFLRVFFVLFIPDSKTFATDPRVVESFSGSVPVKHPLVDLDRKSVITFRHPGMCQVWSDIFR